MALRFDPGEDGAVLVTLTLPAIHLDDVPLGRLPATIDGNSVTLGPFELHYDSRSQALHGIVPASLAPVHELPFTLRRRETLELPPRPTPAAPARAPLWTYDAGSPIWAGVAVAGDLVIAGADDGTLHAVDPRSGERRWVFRAGGPIRTRVAAAGAAVVFQSDDGVLHAVEAATGEPLWQVRVAASPAVRKPFSDPTSRYDRFGSDVTVAGDRLFVGTHEGRLLCLRAGDGGEIWSFTAGDAILAAPTLAGERVVFGSFDGAVYALDAGTGRPLWKHDTGKPVVSTPAVAGRTAIVGSRSYDLLALGASAGDVVWQRYIWFSWVESSPVVRDGVVYVGSSDAAALFAFDARTGRTVWTADVWGWAWGQPAVTATRVYVGTAGQRGYPAPHRGAVVAVDRTDGRVAWQHVLEPEDDATYGVTGSLAAAGGRVFAGGLDGRIRAFAE